MKKLVHLITLAALLTTQVAPMGAFAEDSAAAKSSERPQTYALVSAVGDKFTYVSQKQSTGSNVIDNFSRKVVKVPNNVLNNAVLLGLDKGLAQTEPNSVRVLLSLEAPAVEDVLPQDREAAALAKVIASIEKMPQRNTWDKIVVVTPKFMFSEYSGMGSKLSGLGVYVQSLYSAKLDGSGAEGLDVDVDASGTGASDTTSPEGSKTKSRRYVAPFSYIQKWVLDAKTLKVIEKDARHDFVKLFDPQSTAINVAKSIPDDVLAARILTLAERSAARSMGADLSAVVEIGDVTAIDPKTGAPLKSAPPKK
jgi:hypothetical protein